MHDIIGVKCIHSFFFIKHVMCRLSGKKSYSWQIILVIIIMSIMVWNVSPANALCGLETASSIDFQTITRDELSGQVQMDVTKTGEDDAVVSVYGTDWQDGSSISHMDVDVTRFAINDPNVAYGDKTVLDYSSNPVSIGTFSNSFSIYWQLFGALENLPFTGVVTQTITITFECV